MLFNGIITRETKLKELNIHFLGENTVADLIEKYGTCKFNGDEYVLLAKPALDNGIVPNADFDAFYAQAVKLYGKWEHDAIYNECGGYEDNGALYPDSLYSECPDCRIYNLIWYIPAPISYDNFYSKTFLSEDFSKLEKSIDWEHPDKVS